MQFLRPDGLILLVNLLFCQGLDDATFKSPIGRGMHVGLLARPATFQQTLLSNLALSVWTPSLIRQGTEAQFATETDDPTDDSTRNSGSTANRFLAIIIMDECSQFCEG